MGKIYTRVIEGTDAVSITTGNAYLLGLDFPYEGRIGRFIFKQVDPASDGGTAVDCKVDLLDSALDLDTGLVDPGDVPINLPLHRIAPTYGLEAGGIIEEYVPAVGGDGFLFRNTDGTHTVPERKLYILIQPQSAGDTTKWELAISAFVEIG